MHIVGSGIWQENCKKKKKTCRTRDMYSRTWNMEINPEKHEKQEITLLYL
jgi:hypothetical protein